MQVVDLRAPVPVNGEVVSPPGWFDLPSLDPRTARASRRSVAVAAPPPAQPAPPPAQPAPPPAPVAEVQDWPPVQVEVPRVFIMEEVPEAPPPQPPLPPRPVTDPWLDWAASMFAASEPRSD